MWNQQSENGGAGGGGGGGTAGAGLTGNFDVGANADGSIVVNPDDIQVGVLATDGQHGNRGGGALHANAVAGGAAGFISGANQLKLDGIAAGAQPVTEANVRTALAALTADPAFNSRKLTGLADGVSNSDAATVGQVNALSNGLDWKPSVRVAATGNIVLSGTQTIDGVAVNIGDSVLAPLQSSAPTRGLYTVAAGAWSRRPDANTSAMVTTGLAVFVSEGTANAGTVWMLLTADPIVLGTTSLSFTDIAGPGAITAADGTIVVSGLTLRVGTITDANVAAGNKSGTQGTESLRQIGSAIQAVGHANATGNGVKAAAENHVHQAGDQIILAGLTTAGLGAGDVGYVSSTNTVSKTDAKDTSKVAGVMVNDNVSGQMVAEGEVSANFITNNADASGATTPVAGNRVFLASVDDDAGAGNGKCTVTAQPGGTHYAALREIGTVVDASAYAGSKKCVIRLHTRTTLNLNTAAPAGTKWLKNVSGVITEWDPTTDTMQVAAAGVGTAPGTSGTTKYAGTATPAATGEITTGADGRLHVYVGADKEVPIRADPMRVNGLTTTGLANGDVAYLTTAASTADKSDADDPTKCIFGGISEGVSGELLRYGVHAAVKMTTAGGSPAVHQKLYLAPGTEEAGAAGKLTATVPVGAGQDRKPIAICLDNANYAGAKTAKIVILDQPGIVRNAAGSDTRFVKVGTNDLQEHDPTVDKLRVANLGAGTAATTAPIALAQTAAAATGDLGMKSSGRASGWIGGAEHAYAHVDEVTPLTLGRLLIYGNGFDGANASLTGAMDRDFLQLTSATLTGDVTPKAGNAVVMLLCQGTLAGGGNRLDVNAKGAFGGAIQSGAAANTAGTAGAAATLAGMLSTQGTKTGGTLGSAPGSNGANGGNGGNGAAGGTFQGGSGGGSGSGASSAAATGAGAGNAGGAGFASALDIVKQPRFWLHPGMMSAGLADGTTGLAAGGGGGSGASGGGGKTGASGAGGSGGNSGQGGGGAGAIWVAADTLSNIILRADGSDGSQPSQSGFAGTGDSGGGGGGGGGAGGGAGGIAAYARVFSTVTTSAAAGNGASGKAGGAGAGGGGTGGTGGNGANGGAGLVQQYTLT